MQDFFNHFLPYHQRYNLIPWAMQQIWREIQIPRQFYDPNNINRLRWLIDPTYSTSEETLKLLLRGQLPPRFTYRHFTIPKRNGSRRQLAEPGVDLKAMQHNILENLLKRERPHRAAVGYRKGMSIADHAWAHAGARTVITADIADFFPSTTRYRVRQYWRSHRQTTHDAEVQLLTNLTTYRGSLPQGAPTSPSLSNLVNRELDNRLNKLVTQSGGSYTRYADDMVFSWMNRHRPPSDFEFTVRRILREYGYRLNTQKGWQIWSRTDEPEITGLVLTKRGTVDIPDVMKQKMKQLAQSDDEYDTFVLSGYEGYRQMISRNPRRVDR